MEFNAEVIVLDGTPPKKKNDHKKVAGAKSGGITKGAVASAGPACAPTLSEVDEGGGGGTGTTTNIKALERVKNQLERAKMKRLALQEKLRMVKGGKDNDDVATDGPVGNGGENGQVKEETKPAVTNTGNGSKAQDLQNALQRAKSKLRGALKSRHKALRDTSTTTTKATLKPPPLGPQLPPLSAMSASLIITDISKSGPANLVYFKDDDLGRKDLEDFLGEDLLAELHSDEPPPPCDDDYESDYGSDHESVEPIDTSTSAVSLATRKHRLQEELMALKERLELTQRDAAAQGAQTTSLSTDDDDDEYGSNDEMRDGTGSGEEKNSRPHKRKRGQRRQEHKRDGLPPLTKEELERRKAEAQAVMDISYWKHFVSKQQMILTQVTEQVLENQQALEDCAKEEEEVDDRLQAVDDELEMLETRKRVVEDGITKSLKQLLAARQALYVANRNKSSTGD